MHKRVFAVILKMASSLIKLISKVLVRPSAVLILILVIVLIGSGFLFVQYRRVQVQLHQLNNTQSKEEVDSLIKAVDKLAELPKEEQPTVATVTDKDKLQDQPFFSQSQNGDKVLIYTNSKRALLYRPSTNKIVDITSLNLSNTQAAVPQTQQSVAPRIALYNGTTIVGLTNKAGEKLKADFPQTVVASKGNASRTDFTETKVVDISGNNASLVKQLATSFGGISSTLPEGETKPDADILIILAK